MVASKALKALRGWHRLFQPILLERARKGSTGDLENLKRLLETESG
jgi:hypothetical protein